MFNVNPGESSPIWRQIEEGMRRMITLGALRPGDLVPSVRDLALQLRVNPNTVARAYQRLTEQGVFTVKRGEGTFVADQPSMLRRSERNDVLRDAAMRYAGTAISIGASLDDAVDELSSSYDKVVREHRRKS